MTDDESRRSAGGRSPIVLFLVLSASVILCNLLISELIGLPSLRLAWGEALLGSALLSIVMVLLAYVLVYRPLLREISDRKRVEGALRAQAHLLVESQRLGHVGSWISDPTGSSLWSDEMYRIYGVSPDTFATTVESLLSVIHPDDRPAMQSWIAACSEGARPGELEFRIIRPDGTIRFLMGRGEAVFTDGRTLSHMAGTVQDVTDRRQADVERSETAHRLQEMFDDAPTGYHELDTEGRLIRVNRTELAAMGYEADEMLGRPVWEFVEDQDAARKAVLDKLSGTLVPTSPFERFYVRKDGTRMPVLIQDRILRDAAGGIAGIRTTVQDITVLKRVEAERERLIAELRESLAEVKTLKGFIPICASCKKIRDDQGYWDRVESYLMRHTDARFSHGICPECAKALYPELEIP